MHLLDALQQLLGLSHAGQQGAQGGQRPSFDPALMIHARAYNIPQMGPLLPMHQIAGQGTQPDITYYPNPKPNSPTSSMPSFMHPLQGGTGAQNSIRGLVSPIGPGHPQQFTPMYQGQSGRGSVQQPLNVQNQPNNQQIRL